MKTYRTPPTHKTARLYYRRNGNLFLQFELRDDEDTIYDVSPRGFKFSKLPLKISERHQKEVNEFLVKDFLKKKNFGFVVDLNHAAREGTKEKFLTDNNVYQVN